MKRLDKKSIQKILSDIASGKNLAVVASKFGTTELSIGNIVRGETHAEITGLVKGSAGVKYIQANKDQFIIAKAPRKAKESDVVSTIETPAVEPATIVSDDTPVAPTTRKPRQAKPKTNVAKIVKPAKSNKPVTIEDRTSKIISDAVQIITDCDSEIYRVDTEIENKMKEIESMQKDRADLLGKRDQWKVIVDKMAPSVS